MSNYNNISERPSHHIHKDSEPLPGTGSAPPPPDYNPATIDRMDSSEFPPWNDTPSPSHEEPTFQAPPAQERTNGVQGVTTSDDEELMGGKPARTGGIPIGVQEDLPEGKASATDRLVGKTQKIIGKYAHKPEMHEKGELREAGGKAAAQGQARSSHD